MLFAQNHDVEPSAFCRELQEAQTPSELRRDLGVPACQGEAAAADCQALLTWSMSGAQNLCSSQSCGILYPCLAVSCFRGR